MENANKQRIIRIYQLLQTLSDPEHPVTIAQLLVILEEQYGIRTNRNTLYDDMEILIKCGLPIEVKHSTQNRYYYDGRIFETAELKSLIDAVSASKFITEKKSRALTNKLLTMTSTEEAKNLKRHIYVEGRVKTDNEKGYYILDAVNEAMNLGRKISFQYVDFDEHKERVLKHDGQAYIVSPYDIIWDGDFYYMIGWCDVREKIQTFRLDRIYVQPDILEEEAAAMPEGFDLSRYYKSVFSMFDTDETADVTLLCENRVMKAILDAFGTDVQTKIADEEHFRAFVRVCPSPTFYRWIFGWGYGGAMRIEGPEDVREQYRMMIQEALEKQV